MNNEQKEKETYLLFEFDQLIYRMNRSNQQ